MSARPRASQTAPRNRCRSGSGVASTTWACRLLSFPSAYAASDSASGQPGCAAGREGPLAPSWVSGKEGPLITIAGGRKGSAAAPSMGPRQPHGFRKARDPETGTTCRQLRHRLLTEWLVRRKPRLRAKMPIIHQLLPSGNCWRTEGCLIRQSVSSSNRRTPSGNSRMNGHL